MARLNCPACGAWTDNPALFSWFQDRHNHPQGIPIVFRTSVDPNTFSPVFQKHSYVCHQVTPVSSSHLAVFVSSNPDTPIDTAPRILVNDAADLDALLSAGRRL